jgi:DNA-binding IclR family transcriptional regulator
MSKDRAKSAAVERALAVVDAFEINDSYLSLAELSRRTKIAKPTLLRILQSLSDHHLINRAENGTYYVGPSALKLASIHNSTVRSGRIIIPILTALADKTAETASYSIRHADFLLYIYRKNSPHRLRAHVQPGDMSPIDKSTPGRIILAFEERSNPRYDALRANMFAISSGEIEPGIVSISCPVFNHEERIVGAVSLTGPESRLDKARVRGFTQELLKSASLITSDFGGRTEPYAAALERLDAGSNK